MERAIVNGIDCVIRDVDNIEVYKVLSAIKIKGIPPIEKIEDNRVYCKYIEGDTLRDYIDRNGGLSGPVLRKFIYEIISILSDLNDSNIIHKDLKPENIIIDGNNNVYLIDFNVSRISSVKENDTALFGTRGYASPEHFGYSPTTFKSDMFSLGVIINEIDKDGEFESVAKICTHLDPKDRFDSYVSMLEFINKSNKEVVQTTFDVDNGSKMNEKKRSFSIFKKEDRVRDYYSNVVVSVYSVLYLFLLVLMFLDNKSYSEPIDIIYIMYACFFVLDIADHVRIIVLRASLKTEKKRMIFSSALFIAIISFAFIVELIR